MIVNYRLNNLWIIYNGMCDLAHQNWCHEILFIGAGADNRCAPEFCSLKIMSPTYPITHEELIGAYHLVPDSVQIK